jgi:hypothetical protein
MNDDMTMKNQRILLDTNFEPHTLQHQVVRDLAWCCFSPPLLQELPESDCKIWTTDEPERDVAWLRALDRNPEPLFAHLARAKSTRLGIYYENLWHFYWLQHPHIKLLAHNLQLHFPVQGQHKGATQGAFDFLLQTPSHYWHIETAVKFYLGAPHNNTSSNTSENNSQWHQWIGPKNNDRLDIKLQRLIQHQLPLSQQDNATTSLNALVGHSASWRRALCLQGYFFYPARQKISAPLACHAQHLRGNWWHLKDFVTTDFSGYWLPLAREQWLSPAQTGDIHALYNGASLSEFLQHWIGERQRPLLLAAMKKNGNTWLEYQRSFIMPDQWPCAERPSRNT